MLLLALAKHKPEYDSIALNCMPLLTLNLIAYTESLQPSAVNFFHHIKYHSVNLLGRLSLQILHTRRRHLDALI
jgi:hypothetical protein